MINKQSSNATRQKRHLRIRRTLNGTAARPRLSVYRSNTAFYVQLIDDVNQVTLFAARSTEIEGVKGANVAAAEATGKLIAEKAIAGGITAVVFDRSGYLYHGRIKALADAARNAGLQF
ncbi:MAG: 50S ribosomal protein L18 [Paracholeplasma sp.]|jgi:large subunit ribosomal protein L18|uniref:Large ribosomal subunit protein uL18 n=1 Tax=Acholeplasma brassicae TaxID=61635 RepID=U4KMH1_9MOLU|nr:MULTISPECIES: 50S ribosomal protein L18 [Paracholeplasma]MDY3196074.1 50S ribosomal protein L18 [Paracholeplasma sp.]CCV65271.1 50S ribosomal protein L18 [Paracholeplasma brassicae]HBT59349.1 50S ribosomal protein L18 [Acholeplasmataceae bacterium]